MVRGLQWIQVMPMTWMTIGKVANSAGVGVETIRFYEREGLLAEPPRRESGYREYGADAVKAVRFIQAAKGLGFSLKEIRELMDLRLAPGSTCAEIKERAETKLRGIEDKIRNLRRMKRALGRLTGACDGDGAVSECPILDALEDGEPR